MADVDCALVQSRVDPNIEKQSDIMASSSKPPSVSSEQEYGNADNNSNNTENGLRSNHPESHSSENMGSQMKSNDEVEDSIDVPLQEKYAIAESAMLDTRVEEWIADSEKSPGGGLKKLPSIENFHVSEGGWGWVCVAAMSFVGLLTRGTTSSFSLIYQQLRLKFNSTAAETGWAYSTYTMTNMVFSK